MYEDLIAALERSVEKNGSIQLTTGHLLNLIKMVQRVSERRDLYDDIQNCPF